MAGPCESHVHTSVKPYAPEAARANTRTIEWIERPWLLHLQRVYKSMRSKAYAPSAAKVVDYQERQRLARLRQEEQAKKAAADFAQYELELKARQAEENAEYAKQLGLSMRARSGGRRLGSADDDGDVPPPAKPKPKPKKDSGDVPDPFKRARQGRPTPSFIHSLDGRLTLWYRRALHGRTLVVR